MRTLKVYSLDWDLHINTNGDIEIVEEKAEIAQTVANKIQLFTNDAFFDADRGIPHFAIDLGKNLPLSLARHEYRKAALQTKGVKDAIVNIYVYQRSIRGDVEITTNKDEIIKVDI